MPLLLYTVLFYILSPFLVLRLLQRSLKAPAYRRRIAERFGFFTCQAMEKSLWVHAVSVGEVIAAIPLIRELQSRYPDHVVVVTTMTPTGSERVRDMLGDSVFHVYAPYDLPFSLKRFMAKTRPALLLIMETEIWPNMVCCARDAGVPVVLANARLSEKSARGYARLRALTEAVFSRFSRIVAQTEADAERFRSLGAESGQVLVSGSVKFDITIDDALREQALAERNAWQADRRPVWICASTHEGEESMILEAFSQVRAAVPEALLLVAPRHPERFDAVAALIERSGLGYARRSHGDQVGGVAVLLLDTMGELKLLFGCADVASVGGSFIPRGGHNSLEPAAWGLPLVNGPSDYNFLEISALLQQAGALTLADSAETLAREVLGLLQDDAVRQQRGDAAIGVIEANRGALGRLLGVIDGVLS